MARFLLPLYKVRGNGTYSFLLLTIKSLSEEARYTKIQNEREKKAEIKIESYHKEPKSIADLTNSCDKIACPKNLQ